MEPQQIKKTEQAIRGNDPQRNTNTSRNTKPLPNNPYSILNLEDFIETVTSIPTEAPKNYYQSIKIYTDSLSSPTTRRLYIYSVELDDWLYVALST